MPMKTIYWTLSCIVIGAFVSACGGSTPAPAQPATQIIAPPFGAVFVEGEEVGVQSVSTDADGITRVELWVDGKLAQTETAPSAQGEKQFNVVQRWRAAGSGAHALVVRAFNAANRSAEANIPIAVNPRAVAQATVPPPAVTATSPAPVATATVPPASATAIPSVSTTTAPTIPPPTPLAPTPIPPTAPVIVFLPPFDGGTNILTSYVGGELALQVTAHAGGEDGFNIDRVELYIQDLQGKVLASKTERRAPYCYFGEADGECTSVFAGTEQFRWNEHTPIQAGIYLIRTVVYSVDGRMRINESPVRITLPPDDRETFFVNIEQPTEQVLRRQLDYQARVSGEGVNDANGEGIDRVEMFVVEFNGNVVSAQTERNPQYCGFGDDGLNTPCHVWNFSQRQGKWPNGAPIHLTQYLLRVIAYAKDGRIAADSRMFQIDGFK